MTIWNNDYDPYVASYLKFQEKVDLIKIPEDRILVVDSDMGRAAGFNRVAVHHIALPPHCRTSSPHAESLEEEFVFVVKGSPHLWLNGYLYELKEGHAVGFPAGTGIAHTFINNSDREIHLLVAGERTKSDNLCSFPINLELKESCEIWWDNPPKHDMGPHLGLPGPIRPSDLGQVPPECLVHCPTEPPSEPSRKSFHYPGDNESFGEGFRVTDRVGLKALGIWYEKLPPGKRSAFPHAHTHEEEFIFVLKGSPTIWLNGFAKQIDAGQFAAFPSNTGIAHVVLNNTDEEVIYLCIGETQDFPDEKIVYPHNRLRQLECERKSWAWINPPKVPIGMVSPAPKSGVKDHLAFRPCNESNDEEVLALFQASSAYFEAIEGCSPTMETARHEILEEATNKHEKYFKEFLIIELNGMPIGVLDLHMNHPDIGVCYLGLLLIKEDHFGRGLGRKCYQLAEDYVKRANGCQKVRLGVSKANDVSLFWEKLGFTDTGRTYDWAGETKTSEVREFEKDVT